MNVITDDDIDFIFADLEKKGLTESDLREELADHILCLTEPDLEKGIDFKTSYNSIINSLDENIFRDIQHKTMLATNFKYQNMKKVMFISGITGSILILVGAYFKIYNSPLAGALSLGILLILFVFLPLFFFTAYRERREKKNLLLDLASYLTVTLFILSVLFSNQHWPGASITRTGSLLFAIFAFAPLYMVTVFKKANETKSSVGYLFVIILIAVGGLYIATTSRMENQTKESYARIYSETSKKYEIIRLENDSLFRLLGKKNISLEVIDKVTDLRKVSSIISYRMDNLQNEMVKEADGDSATTTNFTSLANKKAFFKVLLGDRKNSNVSREVTEFRRLSNLLCTNPVDQNIIDENMNANYLVAYYLNPEIKNIPLIAGLVYLNNFKLHIEMAEYHVLKTITY